MLNLYIIYFFIAVVLLLNVASFLRLRENFSKGEKYLFLYLFVSIFLWVVSNVLSDIIKVGEIAIFFSRISIIFPLNILNGLAQIIRNYPRIISDTQQSKVFKIINIIVISFTILFLITLNTDLNIVSYKIDLNGPIDFQPGSAYYVLSAVTGLILFLILRFWKQNLSSYTQTQKIQVYYIVFALLFVCLSMALGLLIFPLYGFAVYAPFMFLSLSFLLFIINESLLVRVAIVDIQEEIIKLIAGLGVAGIMLLFWNTAIFSDADLNLVGKFLVSFLFLGLLNYIYGAITRMYENKKASTEKEIRKFVDMSRSFLRVKDVVEQVSNTISKILLSDRIEYIPSSEGVSSEFFHKFNIWWNSRSKTPFVNREILIESYYDKENNRTITKQIYSFFLENNLDMIIPTSTEEGLKGLIYVYGIKKVLNEKLYKDLTLLSDSISVSVSRASVYEDLENFNKTLQQKVNQQTQELQIKVKQLQEARRKERDMIDIMGHELRTPATVVKLNAELLEQFTDEVLKDKDKFELYVKRIKTAVNNEIKLINTLLSSAKLEGDKIELNPEKINIVDEVEMAIHGNEIGAKEKGLELINNIEKTTPEIYADHARVIEVLNNLVDNAVKYTEKGSIKISSSHTEDNVSISVEDTGKGIAKDELSKLGQKFYRIQNYIDEREGKADLVRPGGTGLGLYVTFGLVEKMGGKMEVESEVGMGTKFTFSLPRYKNQDNGIEKLHSKDMFERLGLKR